MISDALFNADGSLGYNDNDHDGLWGDIIMVNGVPWPTMKVKPRIYRFRVLVASITRSYRPALSNGEPVYIVGTDGGMVPKVQAVSSWRQGTAERYEILIDFRKYRPGQTVDLRNLSNKNNLDFANTTKSCGSRLCAIRAPGQGPSPPIPMTLDDGGSPRCARGSLATMSLTPELAVAKRELRVERENGRMDHQRGDLGRTWKSRASPGASASRGGIASNSGPSSTSRAAGSIRCTST